MVLTNGELRELVLQSARRFGKSRLQEELMNQIRGTSAAWILADEWNQVFTNPDAVAVPEAVFEDKAFPEATIKVFTDEIDRLDPRNPNPAAGPIKRWIVMCGERVIGDQRGYRTLQVAKMKAKTVHEQMVKALLQERQCDNPLFGRF